MLICMLKIIRNKVADYLTRNLLRSILEEDVLRSDGKGGIICRGKRLTKEMVDRIHEEAELLDNSVVMKLVLDDMDYLAQKTMFEKSTSFDDVIFGKAMLYTTDILRKKIKNLTK